MSMSTTKPSLRTLREQFEAGVETKRLEPVDGLLDALDDHDRAVAAIDPRWNATERDQQREALTRAVREKTDELTVRAKKEKGARSTPRRVDPCRAQRGSAGWQRRAANLAAMIARAPPTTCGPVRRRGVDRRRHVDRAPRMP